ncbi:coatomer subunit beta'-2-like protein [Tanacetum coccineum]
MSSTFEIKKTFDQKSERVKSIDLHPTEPWVLVGLSSGNVNIWNYRTQQSLVFRAAKFIANKEWIVCGADDGFIRVYNYNTMESVAELKAHTDFVRSFAVHPSLPYVLSASDDKTIKLWDWENGWECTKTFDGHEHYVMQVAFNPRDTDVFASVSLDSTIKFWDLGSLVPRLSINAHEKGLNGVEFCDTEEKLYFVTGHTNNVTSIQYVKSDVSFIITGSEDKTVCIWNAATHKLDHVFTSELGRVWTIVVIKDSSEIILEALAVMKEYSLVKSSILTLDRACRRSVYDGHDSGPSHVFVRRQIAEARRFIWTLRDKAQGARSSLAQVNVMIAEMEAMNDSNECFNRLMCLRDSRRMGNGKLMGLNESIVAAEEEINTLEAHLEITDAAINSE